MRNRAQDEKGVQLPATYAYSGCPDSERITSLQSVRGYSPDFSGGIAFCPSMDVDAGEDRTNPSNVLALTTRPSMRSAPVQLSSRGRRLPRCRNERAE